MKPRFRNLIKSSLPALIIVPGFTQNVRAQANTILPNAAGDVLISGNYDEINGAGWTILANGGNSAPFAVDILQGASLTGASSLGIGVDVSATGYTINNAGTLDVWHYGVLSRTGETIVNNFAGGIIRGGTDGVRFSIEETVHPEQDIQPLTSESSPPPIDPVVGNPTVHNEGLISGRRSGVVADAGLLITNGANATITGSYSNAITAGENLDLVNDGIIIGGFFEQSENEKISIFHKGQGSGVSTGDSAAIHNRGTITGSSGDGVNTGNDLSLINSGTIIGEGPAELMLVKTLETNNLDGDGVNTGNNATITNEIGGTISGNDDGIEAGRSLELTNSGEITGSGYAGVNTLDGAEITNLGTIHGNLFGILINDSRPNDEIRDEWDQFAFTPLDIESAEEASLEPSKVDNSGLISGSNAGISAGDGLTVDNRKDGVISSSGGTALVSADRLTLENLGAMTGGNGAGVITGYDSSVMVGKSGSIIGNGGSGVVAGDNLTLTNHGSITGTLEVAQSLFAETAEAAPADGIRTGDNATISISSSGSISGTSNGIHAGINLKLDNAGTITAIHDGGANVGVLTGDAAKITNAGQISGDNAGIWIESEPPSIEGKSAATVKATPSTITNSGTISGNHFGIHAAADLTVTNGKTGVINSESGAAIFTGDNLTLSNYGRILAEMGTSGVTTGNGLTLTNKGSILNKTAAGAGVIAQDDATISNLADAVIRGGLHGLSVGRGLTLVNAGTIAGSGTADTASHAGVSSRDGAEILNSGTIKGDSYGIIIDDQSLVETYETFALPVDESLLAVPSRIYNTGSIIGGNTAVSAGNGLEILNASDGEITAKSGMGLAAEDDLLLVNEGVVTSKGIAAVYSSDGLAIDNKGYIIADGTKPPANAKLSVFGDAIHTGDDANIINRAWGLISGARNGITAGQNLNLFNAGIISGNETAIKTLDGLNLVNRTTIFGDIDGVSIGEAAPVRSELREQDVPFAEPMPAPSTITNLSRIIGSKGHGITGSSHDQTVINHGLIAGEASAITLAGGNDVIALHYSSIIGGNIDGGAGIDQLNFYDGAEAIGDLDNRVDGDVTGMESITKTGKGFAFIGSTGGSYKVQADSIEVKSGGLVINGEIASQSGGKTQIILTGGQLEGTGKWNVDLNVVNGVISAGSTVDLFTRPFSAVPEVPPVILDAQVLFEADLMDCIGTLTIDGNVTHNPIAIDSRAASVTPATASYIRLDVAPQTPIIDGVNSDLIVQNGAGNSYDVTGVDVHIAPIDINKALTGGTYTVIDSDSPLIGDDELGNLEVHFRGDLVETGPFEATQSANNSQGTVVANYFATLETADPIDGPGSDSNLVVKIQHNYAGLPGLSADQASLGAVLDAAASGDNSLVQDFIAALDFSDLASVQNALSALDPGSTLGLVSSVFDSNYRLHRLTQNHLAAIRGGEITTQTSAPTTDDMGGIIPGETTTLTSGRGNAWGSFSYDGQDYDASGTRSDFDGDGGSFTAGVDWLVAPNLVAGFVLDGTQSDQDGQGFSSDVDSIRAALYGTWGEAKGFYSDFLVGYGDHSIESTRNLGALLGGVTRVDSDASSFQALLTAGYTMVHENFKHGPFAGFEYQNVDIDSFNQGGILPLTVDNHDVDSLRALIGYRVDADLGKFRPYASVAYAHEFEDGATTVGASFAGIPFTVSGVEQSSALLVTAGTGIALTSSLTLDIGYRGDIATDDGLVSHGGSIGLNFVF